LDGGGIRGVFTAAVLAALEEDYQVRVVDHFDLIAGTSTGGIIALGLGLGYTPREMLEFYVNLGPAIFANKAQWRWLRHWLLAKYPAKRLEDALRIRFADRTLGESTKRLVIPSFNIGQNDVYVFRTAHLGRLRRDFRLPAWHVAMATAAAPTYFPTHRLPDHVRLIDGGVWANNPAMVALVEAVGVEHLGVPMTDVHMLSLGTVSSFHGPRNLLDSAGKLLWAMAAPEVILDASAIGVSNQAKALLGARFLRVNAREAASEVNLDRIGTVEALIASARNLSRKEGPNISAGFFQHRASSFTPHHSSFDATAGHTP
jgi:uncharacterized protein